VNFSDNLHESVFKTGKEAPCGIVGRSSAAHLQNVLSGAQQIEKAGEMGVGRCN